MPQVPYARIFPRDVFDLDRASQQLQRIADTVASSRYANAPVILQLLAEANEVIERVKTKGAGAIQRHLERKGVKVPGDGPEAPAAELGDPEADQGATAAERA